MDLNNPVAISKWLLSEGMCAVWVSDEEYHVVARHPHNNVTAIGPSLTEKFKLKEESLSVHLNWLSHKYDVGGWGRIYGIPKVYFPLESLKHLRSKFPEVRFIKIKDTSHLRDMADKFDTYFSNVYEDKEG